MNMDNKFLLLIFIIVIIVIIIVILTRNSEDKVVESSKRKKVSGGKHKKCKHDSSSSSSSSSTTTKPCCPECPDCNCPECQLCQGGLGDHCAINQQCVSGLSCNSDGTCECVVPRPPVNIQTDTTIAGQLTINWDNALGADAYNIFLNGPTPKTVLNHPDNEVVFSNLSAGVYNVIIFSVSTNCGMGHTFTQFNNIGIIGAACTSDASCTGRNPKCNSTTGVCVECLSNADCGGNAPICDGRAGTCGPCVIPSAPTMISASGDNFVFSASWNAVAGATGYRVKYENTTRGEFIEYCTTATSVSNVSGGNCGGNIDIPCLICPKLSPNAPPVSFASVMATTSCGNTPFGPRIEVPDATCC